MTAKTCVKSDFSFYYIDFSSFCEKSWVFLHDKSPLIGLNSFEMFEFLNMSLFRRLQIRFDSIEARYYLFRNYQLAAFDIHGRASFNHHHILQHQSLPRCQREEPKKFQAKNYRSKGSDRKPKCMYFICSCTQPLWFLQPYLKSCKSCLIWIFTLLSTYFHLYLFETPQFLQKEFYSFMFI